MKNSIIFLCIVGFSFLLGVPYFIIDFSSYYSGITRLMAHYQNGHPGYEGEAGFSQLFFYLLSIKNDFGDFVFYTALFGLICSLSDNYRKALVLLAFPLVLILYFSFQKVNFLRNILSVYVFVAIYFSFGFGRYFEIIENFLSEFKLKRYSLVTSYYLTPIVLTLFLISVHSQKIKSNYLQNIDSRNQLASFINNASENINFLIAEEIELDLKTIAKTNNAIALVEIKKIQKLSDLDKILNHEKESILVIPEFGIDKRFHYDLDRVNKMNLLFRSFSEIKKFGNATIPINYPYSKAIPQNPKIYVYKINRTPVLDSIK